MDENLKDNAIIADLLRSFNQDNVILFAGNDAIKNGELIKEVCDLPWSCIVTTCKYEDFGTNFANNTRTVIEYFSLDDLPLNFYNRNELPVIYLFGKDNYEVSNEEGYDDELQIKYTKKEAEKLINRIMSKMDIRSRMVVIGYNPENKTEIEEETFVFSWQELQGGTISFFNTSIAVSGIVKKYAAKKGFIWYDGSFASLIKNIAEEYKFDEEPLGSETNVFYKGQQAVAIKTTVLSRYHSFMQLLTKERINRIKPLGKSVQSKWFYNFLNNSSDEPQWYGYLPQSDFYFKRNYEGALFATVKNLLSNKNLSKNGQNTPLILEGDSGSSKSIELAALAYEIFEEKEYPVIFINGNTFSFTSQGSEFDMLDELMQIVESLGKKDARFLIIWDSSSYVNNVINEAAQLANRLENRGRRFVLVCTAYKNILSEKEKRNKRNYRYNKDLKKIEKTGSESDLYFYNNLYFVPAKRELSNSELWDLKKKVQNIIDDQKQINKIWDDISQNPDSEIPNDILEYFYKLIILLRPKLEAGLSREQRLVDRYVRKQMALFEKKEDNYNPFREAFQKAGITLNETDLKLIEEREKKEEEEDNNIYDLDRFNTCIAMFSRFKLDVSYSLALRMLCKNGEEYFGKNQVYDNYELFKMLTSQINYIHYVEAPGGDYVFRFRSSLEAEIFFRNNVVTEEQQIDIVLQMIDFYIDHYKKTSEVDLGLKEAIQNITRMYGPNTDYREFWEGGRYHKQHIRFLQLIDKIADKLFDVRYKYHIPDEDCGFAIIEVNLYREIYGTQWDNLHHFTSNYVYSDYEYSDQDPWIVLPEYYNKKTYEERLKKLNSALELAQESLNNLEDMQSDSSIYKSQRLMQASLNTMLVELVLTNRILEKVFQEYRHFVSDQKLDTDIKINTLEYKHLYPYLFKAISNDPLDGYLYNALFKLFEEEYEKSDEEGKLFLLSDVRMIADDANTLPIRNRGPRDRDELSNHLSKIAQYSSHYIVTIADIKNNNAPEPFKKLFKSLLARNNASGICFICQQELDSAKLDGRGVAEYEKRYDKEFVLNQHQLSVCKEIVDFLNNKEYETCIEKSTQALYLRFRVEWMLYNQRPISVAGREWQKTYLNADDWLKIYETCEKYETIKGMSVRPIVTLVYALAKIHINKDYVGAAKIMHSLDNNMQGYQRMRVPYLICFEPGVAEKFNGSVITTDNKFNGFIKVNGFPNFAGVNQGVRFYLKNLGKRRLPLKGTVLTGFELGLTWTGQYSAHKSDDGGELNG